MGDLGVGLAGGRGRQNFRYAAAIPKDYGKSTIGTLILPLWCLAYGHARHICIITASRASAAERMRLVQRELETNTRLRHDFPYLRKLDLRGGSGISRPCDLVIGGALRLVGMYRKSPVSTLSHLGKPPDVLIADDLDGASEWRTKHSWSTWKWWDSTIQPGLEQSAAIVMFGSPRGMQEVLFHRVVCGPEEGWTTRRYSAITKYPDDLRSLRMFEHIYVERLRYRGQTGPVAARAWLGAGLPAALAGGEVAWPAKETLVDLIHLKARMGWMAFDALKQCRPNRGVHRPVVNIYVD